MCRHRKDVTAKMGPKIPPWQSREFRKPHLRLSRVARVKLSITTILCTMSRDNALSWDLDSPDNEIASNSRRDSTSPHYKGAPLSPSASDGDHSKERHRRRSARALVGLDEFAPPKRHYSGAEKLLWSRIRQTLQEPFAEFLGVMVLSCFYNGSIAQSLLSAGLQTAPGGSGYGTFMSVPWGYETFLHSLSSTQLTCQLALASA